MHPLRVNAFDAVVVIGRVCDNVAAPGVALDVHLPKDSAALFRRADMVDNGRNSNLLYHARRMILMECTLPYNRIEIHCATTCFVR